MVRKALIIANGTFDDPTIPALKSPVPDGQRLKQLLERADIGPYDVEFHSDGNCQFLRARIQSFFDDAAPDDLVLLYVTGHGFKDRGGKLYFTTRDSEKRVLGATAIEARFFVERMQECAARTQIWFLDTCYAGAFARGVAFKGATSVTRDDFTGTMPEEDENDRPGRVVITASTAIEMAAEKEAGEERTVQSLFTRYLIEGIETGTPDRENSGVITLDSLFRHVRSKVQAETSRAQSPERWVFGGDGNIALTRNPLRRAELPPTVQKLMRSTSPNKRSDAVRALLELANGQDQQVGALAVEGLNRLSGDRDTVVEAVAKLALGKLGGGQERAQPQAPVGSARSEAVVEPVAQPTQSEGPATAEMASAPEISLQDDDSSTTQQPTKAEKVAFSPEQPELIEESISQPLEETQPESTAEEIELKFATRDQIYSAGDHEPNPAPTQPRARARFPGWLKWAGGASLAVTFLLIAVGSRDNPAPVASDSVDLTSSGNAPFDAPPSIDAAAPPETLAPANASSNATIDQVRPAASVAPTQTRPAPAVTPEKAPLTPAFGTSLTGSAPNGTSLLSVPAPTSALDVTRPVATSTQDQTAPVRSDRNIEFEMLKKDMQKLSETQSAFSGVLNAMNDTAMTAIKRRVSDYPKELIGHWRNTTTSLNQTQDRNIILSTSGDAESWEVTPRGRSKTSKGTWIVSGSSIRLRIAGKPEMFYPFSIFNGQLVFPNVAGERQFWDKTKN